MVSVFLPHLGQGICFQCKFQLQKCSFSQRMFQNLLSFQPPKIAKSTDHRRMENTQFRERLRHRFLQTERKVLWELRDSRHFLREKELSNTIESLYFKRNLHKCIKKSKSQLLNMKPYLPVWLRKNMLNINRSCYSLRDHGVWATPGQRLFPKFTKSQRERNIKFVANTTDIHLSFIVRLRIQ